jgi:Pectate lyase superfamily protein
VSAVSFTLTASPVFPAGSTVYAYSRRSLAGAPPVAGQGPGGASATTSAIVSTAGFAVFEGLEAETAYWAGAQVGGVWAWKGFRTAGPLPAEAITLNISLFGARGDGVSDDTAAIQAAINSALPGQPVIFPTPSAFYGITKPLYLKGGTVLQGQGWVNWWEEGDQLPREAAARMTNPCSIRALPSFAGSAIVLVNDSTVSDVAQPAGQARRAGRIEWLGIGGNRVGSTVDGLKLIGDATDWHFLGVEIADCSRHGLHCESIEYEAGKFHQPQNQSALLCAMHNNASNGWHIDSVQDSDFTMCWGHQNGGEGFLISGTRNTRLTACRGEWNGDCGFLVKGNSDASLLGPITDSNEFWGIKVANEGSTKTIVISNPFNSRDGRNGGTEAEGAKGGLPFAGIGIIGKGGSPCGPVRITGVHQAVGVDDTGAGENHPSNGIYAEHFTDLTVDGTLWGLTNALATGAEAGPVRVSAETVYLTGPPGVEVKTVPPFSPIQAINPSSAGGLAPIFKGITRFHAHGVPATSTASGVDLTPVAGTIYYAEVFIPVNFSLTGLAQFIGTVGSVDSLIVGLWNSAGEALAHSALAGTLVNVKEDYQFIPLTAAFPIKGPDYYLVGIQCNGTTCRPRVLQRGSMLSGSQTGVFGTLPAISPLPTAFTTLASPIMTTY